MSSVFALIRLPIVIHAIIFGLFLATFCDHFLASFGEQFGYKIFLHLATLLRFRLCVATGDVRAIGGCMI